VDTYDPWAERWTVAQEQAGRRADRAAELMSRAYARIDRRAHGTDRHLVSQAFALAANLYAIASGSATRWVVAR
jgi:hypothetical protein